MPASEASATSRSLGEVPENLQCDIRKGPSKGPWQKKKTMVHAGPGIPDIMINARHRQPASGHWPVHHNSDGRAAAANLTRKPEDSESEPRPHWSARLSCQWPAGEIRLDPGPRDRTPATPLAGGGA